MGNEATKVSSYGYRVIKVAPDSPAQRAGLVEFLDFIIDISSPNDQTPFSGNYTDFFKIVQNSEDQPATMKVYNMLYRKTRVVTITPSKKWTDADSLLGALVRYEEYATAHERVLRIAKVHLNSPVAVAGLQPDTDYILGTPQYLYTDLNELAKFIEMTQEKETIKSLEIYIYSSQTNTVRSTLLIPNKNWGGQGYLGCEFALGILNQLPHLEDNMMVSNLGEVWNGSSGDKIDRLDDDDDITEDSQIERKVSENGEVQKLEQNVDEEVIPEFKLRPPTDSEVNRAHASGDHTPNHGSNNYDLSQELTNQRMKLLHISNQHKSHPKTATKAAIRSMRSTSNPFNTSSETEITHSEENVPKEAEKEVGVNSLSLVPETFVAEVENSKEQISKNQADHEDAQNQEVSEEAQTTNEKIETDQTQMQNQNGETTPKAEEIVPEATIKRPIGIPEKQVCKTTIEYNFFSKKLNGDYKIVSSNLFSVDQLGQLN